jgi:hypothetical protein
VEEERIEQDGSDLRDVISGLAGEIGTLVRQEADLVRCELEEKAETAKEGAVRIGRAGRSPSWAPSRWPPRPCSAEPCCWSSG